MWKANGSLGCSNRELVEFKILREASKMNSRITATWDLRRVDFGFFKVCLARSQVKLPWKLKGPRKAEWSRTEQRTVKSLGSWATVAEGQQGCTGNSWFNSLIWTLSALTKGGDKITFRGPFQPKQIYDSILCSLLHIKMVRLLSFLRKFNM